MPLLDVVSDENGMSRYAPLRMALVFLSATFITSAGIEAPSGSVSLDSFGTQPNSPSSNSRAAFQEAFRTLSAKGAGTLNIPGGDFYISFPDVVVDRYIRDPSVRAEMSQKYIAKDKLIQVPSNVKIVGTTDKAGHLLSRIHWKETSFPLISFVNSNHSGISNVAFVFDGVQPHFFPWTQEDFLDAVGVGGGNIGGPHNLSTVIYLVNSENLTFDNLTFGSSKNPADNEHSFAFGIVAYGKSMQPRPAKDRIQRLSVGEEIEAPGLTDCAVGNSFTHLKFSSFIDGLLITGQCSALLDGISGNQRADWYQSFDPDQEKNGSLNHIGGPGHLIYFANQYVEKFRRTSDKLQVERQIVRYNQSRNVTIRNITEGPDTLSGMYSLGTLALKSITGGTVDNVRSQHPAGLIQSMLDVHNMTLTDLDWESNRDRCSQPPDHGPCTPVPVIGLIAEDRGGGIAVANDHITFRNITLKGSEVPIMFAAALLPGSIASNNNITVQGLTIVGSPALKPGQPGASGLLQLQMKDSQFTGVDYTPIVDAWSPQATFNRPVLIRSYSTNVSVDLTIHRSNAQIPDDSAIYQSIVAKDSASANCSVAGHITQ